MEVLTQAQKDFYEEQGYLLLPSHIPAAVIDGCVAEIDAFREEARSLTASNARLDLEDSHTPENPRVRRIKQPASISKVFDDLMRSDHILAPVRDLIGPNLRLHNSKLNMKSAEYGAPVEWHQDWAFYPHTNDDVLAVGVLLNDVDEANGPLMVFPGTQRDPIYDHHSGGVFAGTMDLDAAGLDVKDAVKLTGPRGSISIHHARTVHGSALNTSNRDRMLLLYEILAADAFPVFGCTMQWTTLADYDAKLLCGKGTVEPRLAPVPVRIPQPQPPKAGSIYEVQSASAKKAFATYKA
jgi:ectoine hydroxylase-related dioxygenase (phytanoyl-CoA dioxygenase family)